jgi:ABC-2 type transport system permease protein
MNKTLLVAKREYISTVRRKGFIITTFGLPFILALIYGIIGGAAYFAVRQSREKTERIGLVDESALIQLALMDRIVRPEEDGMVPPPEMPSMFRDRAKAEAKKMVGKTELKSFRTRTEANLAFVQKDIRGYYVIPADFLRTGKVELEIKKGLFMSDSSPGWDQVRKLISASLVEGRLEPLIAQRVWTPAVLNTQALNDAGRPDKRGQYAEISSFAIPYAFMILFMLSVMSGAGYLMQGISEEKENRVIEILLSSVTPEQLLGGKIIGLCAAGLTQIAAWITIVALPAGYFMPFLDLRWDQLIIALVFFPLGYLVFGSLMGGTASLGNNFRESQQASMVWTMSAIIPLFFFTSIISQPNGTFARVLSYIPLTAPGTIVMRVGVTHVPWWEVAASAAVLIASLIVIIRLSAKLFRMGTLMYGKKPSLVEIVRWLRAS